MYAQQRLRSAWVSQADLSLRWAHSHFVGFVMRWLICVPLATLRHMTNLSSAECSK